LLPHKAKGSKYQCINVSGYNAQQMYSQSTISEDASIIPLDLVKKYLRIDHEAEDEIILMYMKNSYKEIEYRCGVILSGEVRKITVTDFAGDRFSPQRTPIRAIESILIDDVPLDPSAYTLVNQKEVWLQSRQSGKLDITLKLGYNLLNDIPSKLQTAFLQIASHIYQNKNGWNASVPRSIIEMSKEFQKIKI
jgi:uncharacterized phiE125 gp8 family phage protein